MGYVFFEAVLSAFLARHLFLVFRPERTSIKGIFTAVGIALALTFIFASVVPDCSLWSSQSIFSSLYGEHLPLCFLSMKQRVALSFPLSFLYGSLIAAPILVLTMRSKRRAKTHAL